MRGRVLKINPSCPLVVGIDFNKMESDIANKYWWPFRIFLRTPPNLGTKGLVMGFRVCIYYSKYMNTVGIGYSWQSSNSPWKKDIWIPCSEWSIGQPPFKWITHESTNPCIYWSQFHSRQTIGRYSHHAWCHDFHLEIHGLRRRIIDRWNKQDWFGHLTHTLVTHCLRQFVKERSTCPSAFLYSTYIFLHHILYPAFLSGYVSLNTKRVIRVYDIWWWGYMLSLQNAVQISIMVKRYRCSKTYNLSIIYRA